MDIIHNRELAERLKVARKATGLNQSKLAETLGVTRGHWSNLEAGRAIPNKTLLFLFQNIYGFRGEWIVDGTGQMYVENTSGVNKENMDIPLSERIDTDNDIKGSLKDALREEIPNENTHKLILAYLEELLSRSAPIGPWVNDTAKIRKTAEPTLEVTEMRLNIPGPPDDLDEECRRYWDNNAAALQRWAATPDAIKSFPKRTVPPWAIERFLRETRQMYAGGSVADVSGVLWDLIDEGPKAK